MKTRKFVWIFGLVVALILAGLVGYQKSSSGSALAASSVAPVGSWVVTIQAEGQPTTTEVVAYHSDGTMTVARNGGSAIGVWKKTSRDSYAFTVWGLLDPDLAPPLYRAKVVGKIQLSKDGEQYTGSFTAYLYDQDGNLLFPSAANVTAVRMHVESLP
jgi:hypothetical protein